MRKEYKKWQTEGVTRAKQKISKATGIPWTKAGRQRKIGKALTGGGCLLTALSMLGAAVGMVALFISFIV